MTTLEKRVYTAEVTATGGRDGRSASPDGVIDFKMGKPAAMGGKDDGYNPEQLFAAGNSACFFRAVKFVSGKEGNTLPHTMSVTAKNRFGPIGGDLVLRRIWLSVLPVLIPPLQTIWWKRRTGFVRIQTPRAVISTSQQQFFRHNEKTRRMAGFFKARDQACAPCAARCRHAPRPPVPGRRAADWQSRRPRAFPAPSRG